MKSLEGRTALVTGATSGIGLVTAKELARLGATVVLTGRDQGRLAETRLSITEETGNRQVYVHRADFTRLDDVRTLAEEVLIQHEKLHILVNNAGCIVDKRQLTEDGYETTFQVNYLAPFLLTNLLLDRVRSSSPARIVNVGSDGYRAARRLPKGDLSKEPRKAGFSAYAYSKLALMLFGLELTRRLEGSGVTVNTVHPGHVSSGFAAGQGGLTGLAWRFMKRSQRSPEVGADTVVWATAAPELEDVSGGYWYERQPMEPIAAVQDLDDALRLWEATEAFVGLG